MSERLHSKKPNLRPTLNIGGRRASAAVFALCAFFGWAGNVPAPPSAQNSSIVPGALTPAHANELRPDHKTAEASTDQSLTGIAAAMNAPAESRPMQASDAVDVGSEAGDRALKGILSPSLDEVFNPIASGKQILSLPSTPPQKSLDNDVQIYGGSSRWAAPISMNLSKTTPVSAYPTVREATPPIITTITSAAPTTPAAPTPTASTPQALAPAMITMPVSNQENPGMVTAACIEEASQIQQVPVPIILGFLKTEGGWVGAAQPNSNGSYDLGPMQVNDQTWVPVMARLEFGGDEAAARVYLQWNGCYNVQVGTWIFRNYWNEAGGNTAMAIGYYNSHDPVSMIKYQAEFARSLRAIFGGR